MKKLLNIWRAERYSRRRVFIKGMDQRRTYARDLYEKEVLLKAAYAFTDRAYIHLDVSKDDYLVEITPKNGNENEQIFAEFENELIAQEMRRIVAEKTKNIREMIVARALSSTIIDLKEEDMDEEEDSFEADLILTNWYEQDGK